MLCVMAQAVVPCLFMADISLYLPIYVPCNGGNPSALTWWSSVYQIFFPAATGQLRNWSSRVIFRHIYSPRAPTIPGSLQAFHMAYCLHHSFFLYTLSIIGWGKSICQVFLRDFLLLYICSFHLNGIFTDCKWFFREESGILLQNLQGKNTAFH